MTQWSSRADRAVPAPPQLVFSSQINNYIFKYTTNAALYNTIVDKYFYTGCYSLTAEQGRRGADKFEYKHDSAIAEDEPQIYTY